MADETELLDAAIADCERATADALRTAKDVAEDVDRLQRRNDCAWLGQKKDDLVAFTSGLRELMTKMIAGDRVDVDAAEERLSELQELLADIRPVVVEQKTAANGGGLTARPELLAVDSGDEVESDDEDELAGAKKATPKYEAPKLVPMHFDENEEERKTKRVEKARKRAMQSSLIQDLHAQYSEAPQVITDAPRMSKMEAEMTRFEEHNYMRLQLTKREKQMMRRKENQGTLDSLLKFGDYMAMDTVLEDGGGKKAKKRKAKFTKKGAPSKKKAKGASKRRR